MRCPRAADAGAYVLGALTPAERSGYGRHLAGCAQCRDEVTDLAALPGLLGRLDAPAVADVTQGEPPTSATLLPGLLRRAAVLRRRARWRLALANAAALVLVVALTAVALLRIVPTRPGTATVGETHVAVLVPMTPAGAGPEVAGQIALEPAGGGTRVDVHCVYVDHAAFQGEWHLTLVLYPRNGAPVTAQRWSARAGDDMNVTATVSMAPADIAAVEIHKGDGSVVLRYVNS